ncbi:MAG: Fic family protein, partial [Phycisphaerales bacterium]|nr:Fic family protein [Phycisphaerales bacterium]
QSSLTDLLKAEASILDPMVPRDVDEVLNYVNAMKHGLARLDALPFSVRLIRELHEKLMEGVRGQEMRPGELRTSQNWIGPQGCTPNTAAFVPPPHNLLPPALGSFEKYLHGIGKHRRLPTLIEIGLAHAHFETLHPFLDGNGRVGRLLITFLLCQRRVLERPVLYLSHYFKRNRTQYYEMLQGVRDNGAWEAWLRFFLTGVAEVSNEATETARRIVDLRERHRAHIAMNYGKGAASAILVLEALYKRPILGVADVREITSLGYSAANDLVSKMVSSGVLQETTGFNRNRRFMYADYVALFKET